MYVVFIAIIVHIVYPNTVIVCIPHPCSSSCIFTILYCIVIQYYSLHYAFHLSHSLMGTLCRVLELNCVVQFFTYFCVIIQTLYNGG